MTSSPHIADARIRLAADGDRQAAESLLRELLPRMRNLIRYLVRGDGEVDDIAQEALIAVARGFRTYRGDGKLSSWVDRIVARTTFAYLARVRRDSKRRADYDDQVGLAAVPHPDGPPDRYTRRRELVHKLDRIPDDQRRALVLHHSLGMSVPEIAAELDVSPETVRSRLRLGRAKMRALLDTQGGDR